ncbi:MAG: Mo-dependent nitrogenase C-terminal domain-containing protein [Chroococcidiopsidaceae cyanobacterium CP_BM_RX_35]|nr:Mo-dependent nitrogenase C-terminal domain-containing protein [Chroococcidiopsidaceae cyanobacterium CP_BM_RX_35]
MNATESSVQNLSFGWVLNGTPQGHPSPKLDITILQPVRRWLNRIEVRDPKLARCLCRVIPAQCPFECKVKFFGHTIFHIPPLCQLNPLYEEVIGLRFRSLCYLADECGEDVTPYC